MIAWVFHKSNDAVPSSLMLQYFNTSNLSSRSLSLKCLQQTVNQNVTWVLADFAIKLGDAPFTVMIKQRLMMRVLASSTKCMCGQDATNEHVNTCQKQYGGGRIQRHNDVVYALQTWAQQLGYAVTIEPRISEANKHRMDLIIHTSQGTYATDVSIVYPARVRQNASGAMQQQYRMKELKWTAWAQDYGAYFEPFILESTGGVHYKSLQWLTSLAGASPHPYNVRTAVFEALIMITKSVHQGNARIYAKVRESWTKKLMYPNALFGDGKNNTLLNMNIESGSRGVSKNIYLQPTTNHFTQVPTIPQNYLISKENNASGPPAQAEEAAIGEDTTKFRTQ